MTGVSTLDAPKFESNLQATEILIGVITGLLAIWATLSGVLFRVIRWGEAFIAMPETVADLRLNAILADARHRAVVEGTKLAYWESSVDGNCQYASRGLAELMGCEVSQILRMGWVSRIHPLDQERVRERYLEAVQSGSSFLAEYRIVRADHSVVWVLAEATPGFGTNGSAGIFIGSMRATTRPDGAE